MKTFLAIAAGLFTSIIAIQVLEYLGHVLFPLPFKLDINNIEDWKMMMSQIPIISLISVIVAHGIGLLFGFAVSRLVEKESSTPLYVITSVLILLSVVNLVSIPHPAWFAIADIGVLLTVSILYIRNRTKA